MALSEKTRVSLPVAALITAILGVGGLAGTFAVAKADINEMKESRKTQDVKIERLQESESRRKTHDAKMEAWMEFMSDTLKEIKSDVKDLRSIRGR